MSTYAPGPVPPNVTAALAQLRRDLTEQMRVDLDSMGDHVDAEVDNLTELIENLESRLTTAIDGIQVDIERRLDDLEDMIVDLEGDNP